MPPAAAFWSVTMYEAEGFQAANELDRFALDGRWHPPPWFTRPDGRHDRSDQPLSPTRQVQPGKHGLRHVGSSGHSQPLGVFVGGDGEVNTAPTSASRAATAPKLAETQLIC